MRNCTEREWIDCSWGACKIQACHREFLMSHNCNLEVIAGLHVQTKFCTLNAIEWTLYEFPCKCYNQYPKCVYHSSS